MRKLIAVAAFLLASTAAQAQYTFEYGGRTIRIDPDRGTVSIPGVFDNTGRRTKRSHNDQDSDRPRKQTPQQAKTDPQAPEAAPTPAAPAQIEPAPAVASTSPEPSTATARIAPTTDTIISTQPSVSTPAVSTPAPQLDAAPAVRPELAVRPEPAIRPEPAPVVATTAPASAPIQNQAPAPATTAAQSANSPLGMWLTEEKEGKVRIEQCGANLCGYSVDAKSNQNGEKVLINMRPAKDSKWTGRIYDPNTGSTYDSTIALKGSDNLRVQGCAFGGMFCGGQTWSRLN
jgi:uncharacterized protein (DUF2147 family)